MASESDSPQTQGDGPRLTDRERVAVLWAISSLETDSTPDAGQNKEAAEILATLATAVERPCPYVTGTVTRYCTLTPFTLSSEEREAIYEAAHAVAQLYAGPRGVSIAATLRGLLERTR